MVDNIMGPSVGKAQGVGRASCIPDTEACAGAPFPRGQALRSM